MTVTDETIRFNLDDLANREIEDTILSVYNSLKEKDGYDPINQLVGYILSGDPAYIPRHNDARARVSRLNRDDIVEELIRDFLKSRGAKL